MSQPRRARIQALAKINLSLEVLNRRPDGFHNLRTVFQTISLADEIELDWTPGRPTSVELDSTVDIPRNLAVRAAEAVLEESHAKGSLHIRLTKHIPMGGGLGGGSADAAAVLIALPVLTGRTIPPDRLSEIAGGLGSDVPFFLHGGTALGLERGTEVYPVPDAVAPFVLLATPGLHVSTPEAYRALGRGLTVDDKFIKMNVSQSLACALGAGLSPEEWSGYCRNDFESVVFLAHPQLKIIKGNLMRAGARPALMSGSGSAIFGIFPDRQSLAGARAALGREKALPVSTITRRRYRQLWWRSMSGHLEGRTWPLQSRYSR
jgi:4-diphosphocytidyl-2-C-methyl-D-erythritol kinase